MVALKLGAGIFAAACWAHPTGSCSFQEPDKNRGAILHVPDRQSTIVVDIGIPLPLQAQFVCIELIAFLRGTDRICLSYVRFFVSQYRFATTVAILVFTDYRPVVYPFYRLQVNQTSGCTHILEVQEPVFSAWSIYPASLMRSVDRAVALCQHGFPFIRSVYVFERSTTCQPVGTPPAGWKI